VSEFGSVWVGILLDLGELGSFGWVFDLVWLDLGEFDSV